MSSDSAQLLPRSNSSLQGDEANGSEDHKDAQMAAFVPRKLLPQLPAMAATEPSATMQEIEGVVSFLDLAGFTKLTERLALQSDGAERLAKIINKLMGQLLDTLKSGDTIKFSGDAICVLYEPEPSDKTPGAPEAAAAATASKSSTSKGSGPAETYADLPAMQNAAYRAVSEGLEALFDDYTVPAAELGDFGDASDPASRDGIQLALHVAITAGKMQFTNVGGVFGRWEVLLAGPAMQALGPTADRAPTDWCTVHPECWALLEGLNGGKNPFVGQHMGPGAGCPEFDNPDDMGFVRVTMEPGRVQATEAHKAAFSGSLRDYKYPKDSRLAELEWGATLDLAHHFLGREAVAGMHPVALAVLRRYVEPLVKQALKANALAAVSCFTDVSVLFLGISEVDLGAMHPTGGDLWGQLIMATAQECVYDQEGAVNKFVMDDKGALLLCAWGLPPLSHADDPHRATTAALVLASKLAKLGAKARIGVTTGKVFAGVIGPRYRCEFSILGDAVNLAARLMSKAPFGGVLCDEPTYETAVAYNSTFEVLPPIKVKGKEALIPIFRPYDEYADEEEEEDEEDDAPKDGQKVVRRLSSRTGAKRRQSLKLADNYASGASVLGSATHIRSAERAMLTTTLASFFADGNGGGVLLLAGDAGSGKSELATLVPKSAKEHQVRLIESKSPKNKGSISDIASNPCLEISQVLRALLAPETASIEDNALPVDSPKGEAGATEDDVSTTGPSTIEEWQQLLKDALAARPDLIESSAQLFDAYFREWCGLPPATEEEKETTAAAGSAGSAEAGGGLERSSSQQSSLGFKPLVLSEQGDPNDIEGSRGRDLAQQLGDHPNAAARRDVLGAVLERALVNEPLLIFVHVRTGSSLSSGTAHPEMWPLIQWLSNFAASRHSKPCAQGSNPMGVVFVNRRILDQGGKRQNEAVASVVKDARACQGLLQLDPLDADDRYSYLCLSLKASWVPPEVSAWVSGIANGNPQYTEICAKALEKAEVLELKPVEDEQEEGQLPRAEYKEGAESLAKLDPPPKIAGFIRSTLGALAPEERLITQVASLFSSAADMGKDPRVGLIDPRFPSRPTAAVLKACYETVAPIDEDRLTEVLGRLSLYGIVVELEDLDSGDGAPFYSIVWPLLKDIATSMLLRNQRKAIIERLCGDATAIDSPQEEKIASKLEKKAKKMPPPSKSSPNLKKAAPVPEPEETLSKLERQRCRMVFDRLDLDGNKTLDESEIFAAMNDLGVVIDRAVVKMLFDSADRNKNGVLSRGEFETLYAQVTSSKFKGIASGAFSASSPTSVAPKFSFCAPIFTACFSKKVPVEDDLGDSDSSEDEASALKIRDAFRPSNTIASLETSAFQSNLRGSKERATLIREGVNDIEVALKRKLGRGQDTLSIDNIELPSKDGPQLWDAPVVRIEPAEAAWVRQRVQDACKRAGVRALHRSAFKQLVTSLLKEMGLPLASDADLDVAFVAADEDGSKLIEESEFEVLYTLIAAGKVAGLAKRPWPESEAKRAARVRDFKDALKMVASGNSAPATKSKISKREAKWVRQRVQRACTEAGVRALHKTAFKKLVTSMVSEMGQKQVLEADLEVAFKIADEDGSKLIDEDEFMLLYQAIKMGKVAGLGKKKPWPENEKERDAKILNFRAALQSFSDNAADDDSSEEEEEEEVSTLSTLEVRRRVLAACTDAGVRALHKAAFKKLVNELLQELEQVEATDADLGAAFVAADEDESKLVDDLEFAALYKAIVVGGISGLGRRSHREAEEECQERIDAFRGKLQEYAKIVKEEVENASEEVNGLVLSVEEVKARVREACQEAGVRALHRSAFNKLTKSLLEEAGQHGATDADLEAAFLAADEDNSKLVDENEFAILYQAISAGKIAGLGKRSALEPKAELDTRMTAFKSTLKHYARVDELELVKIGFDIRDLLKTMDASKALEHVAMRLGQRYEFFKPTASGEKALCDARILSRLMKAITSSYQESNPYHNCLHATDVLLTSNAYLEHSGVLLLRKSTGAKARPFDWRLSRFALMLAAAGHDVGHPARLNTFMVATKHPLTLPYLDKGGGVLEAMHAATMGNLLRQSGQTVLDMLSTKDQHFVRETVQDLILSTDLTKRSGVMDKFLAKKLPPDSGPVTSQVPGWNMNFSQDADRLSFLRILLNAADVSNPAKERSLYLFWTNRVLQEFYDQGDEEARKGLPVTTMPCCDRSKPAVVSGQKGFISFVVKPIFEPLCDFSKAVFESEYLADGDNRAGLSETIGKIGSNFEFWNTVEKNVSSDILSKVCLPSDLPPPYDAVSHPSAEASERDRPSESPDMILQKKAPPPTKNSFSRPKGSFNGKKESLPNSNSFKNEHGANYGTTI